MNPDAPPARFERPPAPVEQLREQSLKNREVVRKALEDLPDERSVSLRAEFGDLCAKLDAAYDAGDAAEHYRLDRYLFFNFWLELSFALQINRSDLKSSSPGGGS